VIVASIKDPFTSPEHVGLPRAPGQGHGFRRDLVLVIWRLVLFLVRGRPLFVRGRFHVRGWRLTFVAVRWRAGLIPGGWIGSRRFCTLSLIASV
jgi:hypothetical protein